MKEVHGVIAKKVEHVFADDEKTTRVIDSGSTVLLGIAAETARLTPDEARFMAKQLIAAAGRAEKPKP